MAEVRQLEVLQVELFKLDNVDKHMNDFTTGHNLEILLMPLSVPYIEEQLLLQEHS